MTTLRITTPPPPGGLQSFVDVWSCRRIQVGDGGTIVMHHVVHELDNPNDPTPVLIVRLAPGQTAAVYGEPDTIHIGAHRGE